jgi:ectoine hydroxylase-related dioxygenase (phytanoyl-CoA dioxygenase family)
LNYIENGYEILHDFISHGKVARITKDICALETAGRSGGIRNIEKKLFSVRDLASSDLMMSSVRNYLTDEPFLVRAILFNKTIKNNWSVRWHQDRTIAVSHKFEHTGWGPWSIKDGVDNVQPPIEVLEQMVIFRIHLDDTCEANGSLKVIPKSHKEGILNVQQIKNYINDCPHKTCDVKKGGMLVMKPYLLHSSNKAKIPSQRRVIHLEYSSYTLPSGVTWV